jgi:hypothetical protein
MDRLPFRTCVVTGLTTFLQTLYNFLTCSGNSLSVVGRTIAMLLVVQSGIRLLEIMFFTGLAISSVSVVLGMIDDIKTFIQY